VAVRPRWRFGLVFTDAGHRMLRESCSRRSIGEAETFGVANGGLVAVLALLASLASFRGIMQQNGARSCWPAWHSLLDIFVLTAAPDRPGCRAPSQALRVGIAAAGGRGDACPDGGAGGGPFGEKLAPWPPLDGCRAEYHQILRKKWQVASVLVGAKQGAKVGAKLGP